VVVEESLNQHLDNAVKHYSSLFKLPSHKKIIFYSAIVCVVGGLLNSVGLYFSYTSLVKGIILGFSLLFVTLLSNYVLAFSVLRNDPIYNLRRTAALSFFSWILWFPFILMGSIAALFLGSIWSVRLYLIGFSAVLILRFIVLHATSSGDCKRLFAASVLLPFSCLIPLMFLWANVVDIQRIFLFSVYATILCLLSGYSFIILLNRVGEKIAGITSLQILKAFLLNWVVNINAPFETILERLGEERDIKVSVAKFDSYKSTKAVIVVPSVHPGPFKNVGSSLLPSLLKTALEQKLNCIACVPLGLLGHELDLTSQHQNQKIIEAITTSIFDFKASETEATPLVKVSKGLATACCQIFGKSAIVTFSLAPKTTEDFPQELALFVRDEAKKRGLQHCIVINAHNSIDGAVNQKEVLEALENVTVSCLKSAVYLKRKTFKVGVSTLIPKDFTLSNGMGQGGITALVVQVDNQKAAYIVIDGNNMISGLREKILSALYSLGITEGEIFTTDTHSVNALTLNARGYHPIGEAMDHKTLIDYIEAAVNSAMANLEHVKVGYKDIIIPKVKVIGHEPLEKLCTLPDKAIQRAKRILIPLFGFTFILLMGFLIFI